MIAPTVTGLMNKLFKFQQSSQEKKSMVLDLI